MIENVELKPAEVAVQIPSEFLRIQSEGLTAEQKEKAAEIAENIFRTLDMSTQDIRHIENKLVALALGIALGETACSMALSVVEKAAENGLVGDDVSQMAFTGCIATGLAHALMGTNVAITMAKGKGEAER